MCEKAQLDAILASIAQRAQNTFRQRLEAVILYGSYARGDFDMGSDIDVMVLVDLSAEELIKYRKEFSDLAAELSLHNADCTTVSLMLKDKATFEKWLPVMPFYQNIMREGIRISI